MNESLLLKLSLTVAAFGITILFFFSRYAEGNDTNIEKISSGEEDYFTIEGYATGIKKYEGRTAFTLNHNSEISVVAFASDINFSQNDKIKVSGRYGNNKREIIADKIMVIR